MTSHDRKSAVAMLLGIASVVTNDAIVKFAGEAMPLSQLMCLRGAIGTMLLVVMALTLKERVPPSLLTNRWVLLRAGIEVLATVAYLSGLMLLQLPNATAIAMATPLVSTLLAILVLRERVSAGRWCATIAGFAGVLLIVQPASREFNAGSLLVLASVFLMALRDIVTRSATSDISSMMLTIAGMVAVMLFSAAWGLAQDWRALSAKQFALIALAAFFLASGFFAQTVAIRQGGVSLLAPLRYVALVFSSALGFAIWGYVPNALAWCGMAVTVVAGIYFVRAQ